MSDFLEQDEVNAILRGGYELTKIQMAELASLKRENVLLRKLLGVKEMERCMYCKEGYGHLCECEKLEEVVSKVPNDLKKLKKLKKKLKSKVIENSYLLQDLKKIRTFALAIIENSEDTAAIDAAQSIYAIVTGENKSCLI